MATVQKTKKIDKEIIMYKLKHQKTIQCETVLTMVSNLKTENDILKDKNKRLTDETSVKIHNLKKKHEGMLSKKDYAISKQAERIKFLQQELEKVGIIR